MSAFTIAGSIEKGHLVTFLSYPTSRRSILLVRVIFLSPICTICSALVLGVLLPVIQIGGICE